MDIAKIYTLFSSSKGNCTYIKYGNDEFLIDCGASAKAIDKALKSIDSSLDNIKAMFITHEHYDHIRGLPIITKYFKMPIYAPLNSCDYIAERIAFGTKLTDISTGTVIELSNTAICPIATPHDSRGSVGFRIRAGEEKIGYFTDIGHLSEGVLRGLSGCRRIVLESNHDIEMLKNGPYPYPLKQRILGNMGHLSNEMCAHLLPHLVKHGTESILLAHLSEENNRPETAFQASFTSLMANGYQVNTDGSASVRLAVAPVCGIKELL